MHDMKCYIKVTIWYSIYSPDFKCFETLLKHYYVTGADFKRFVTFWKRLSSDSVCVTAFVQHAILPI